MADTPKIRFKGFTDAWEQRKFGDLGYVSMCKRIFKGQTTTEGEIPFYKIGTFGGEPDAFISRELFEEYKEKFQYPEIGDMLISASGTIGRTVEYTGEDVYFQDSNIVWFKHDERVDNSFLKCVYSFVKWSGIEGSTIKRLYNDNFLKTEFSIPTIEEQQRIGAYFSQIDHLITLHQHKCDEIKELKKYMLQKMFPRNGEKIPEIRFAGFTGDWEQRKLGDICESFEYGLNVAAKEYDGENKYIRITDIDDNSHEFLQENVTSPDTELASAENYRLQYGDILFARTGASVGKTYIYKDSDGLVYYAGFLIRGRVKDGFVPEFVFQNTLTAAYEKFIHITSQRSGQPGVNAQEYAGYEVSMPTYEEQKKIGLYFSNLDTLIILHQRECDELKEVKKFMLQNMFPQKG